MPATETAAPAATGAAARFFTELGRSGRLPQLGTVSGTIRFDIVDGSDVERWYVTLAKGDVSVSQNDRESDASARAERALFDGIASGRVNVVAAMLRGLVEVDGDLGLLMVFQKLFPGPPRAGDTER
ncbi:MAG TPA: SCP2 sterol-binding domain-containing protein [Acidimicrobiia bacterium]|nr:SCP2 sterol-binding domain-containing protein [Acidimicrobiia bacterium]